MPFGHALQDSLVANGPGWFDSSWDLRRGCDVREGWPDDTLQRMVSDEVTSRFTASPSSTTAIA